MGGSRRGTRRTWICRCAAVLLGALAVSNLFSAATLGAQDTDGIVKGGANASADSMGFQIVNGGASLGWTLGRSTAAYRDITATSEGKEVDLGSLGALLGQPQCLGLFPPAINQDTMPPQTIADSATPGSDELQEAEVIFPRLLTDTTPDRIVGVQRASALPTPSSQSSTSTRNQDFGFFRVEGAESSAETSFENGVRTAHAVTTAKRIVVLGGLVVFYGPRWEATAQSGATDEESADFTFSSAQVFGNFVSGANLDRDLAIVESLVEGILQPLGVDLEFPEVTAPFSGTGIAVSPMKLTMSDAPIGNGLLIPLLNTDVLKQYRIDTVEEDCRNETFWTILDALERALGGSGSLETLIGGVSATTDDTDYAFHPLEESAPPTVAPAPVATVEPTTPPALSEPTPFDPGTYDDFGDTGGSYGSDLGSSYGSDLGLTDSLSGTDEVAFDDTAVDEPTSSDSGDTKEIAAARRPSEDVSNVAAIVVGVLALLGAVALSLGDRVMGRRARRRIA